MQAPKQVQGADIYASLYADFRWHVPANFNIAEACALRWAKRDTVALYCEDEAGHRTSMTYAQLAHDARRLSKLLTSLGIAPGDRVAIILPQCIETAVAHIACYQMGAIAMPLSMLFGPEALEYRLRDSAASVVVCDASVVSALEAIRPACPTLKHVLTRGAASGYVALMQALDAYDDDFELRQTDANGAAILIYTSGTTGAPKGALIPHRALIGNLTGFVASQNWFPQPGDVFWSPADWAWTGGLMDALLPCLYFGMPIVGYHGRFNPVTAFNLMQSYGVTNTFLFPTALKMMMKAVPEPRAGFQLKLRAIMSAGEAVGDTVYHWCREALGIEVNEMFGQTEMNYIVGNSAQRWPVRPGSMGRPYPGHKIALIDDLGRPVGRGEIGEIALCRHDMHGDPDPIFFLGYWQNDAATKAKFAGDWCRTGDLASEDEDGYLWYQGRADDMFKSAGYRIGPSEIENCLIKHPSVSNAAVVPKPDPERGNLVKAYVVLTADCPRGPAHEQALRETLQVFVKSRLAPYEYPKEIEFIDQLPMTTTGKVQRRILREREQTLAQKARN